MQQYKDLISKFLGRGYKDSFFSNSHPETGMLILRHDIDFDIGYAYDLSLIEDELGVKSTYFFLLHSRSYNLLEQTHLEQIASIKSRGHRISIHFDPTLYRDIEQGLQHEKELFEKVFDVQVEFISIHRPSDYFLNNPHPICGVGHTYQPTFFRQVKYFADSQGQFRYGNPIDSVEFANMQTIQLLIHPIWWLTKSPEPLSKLYEFLNSRVNQLMSHMAANCIPFKTHLEEQNEKSLNALV